PYQVLGEPGLRHATPQHQARRPDERVAPTVLGVAGLLADEHDGRARGPLAEDCLGGVAPQVAAAALLDGRRQLRQRGAGTDEIVGPWVHAGSSAQPRPEDPLEEVQRSEEHTSELQSQSNLVCRLLLEKKNTRNF